jgi:hypothetical protein
VSLFGTILRRRILALLAFASVWGGSTSLRALSRIGTVDAAPLLAGLLADRRSAEAVGLAYLRTIDHADLSREDLMQGLPAEFSAMAPAERQQAIGARIRRDFAEGVVVTVDGWMLSRTEARLCALAALS